MKQVNAWVPPPLHRALVRARETDRVSINQVIREAVELWLASRKKRPNRKGG